jgi:hypothetical protein
MANGEWRMANGEWRMDACQPKLARFPVTVNHYTINHYTINH